MSDPICRRAHLSYPRPDAPAAEDALSDPRSRMTATGEGTCAPPAKTGHRRPVGSVEILAVVLIVALLARGWLLAHTGSPAVRSWVTIFVSVVVQAMPFVVLGTVLSAAISAFVPP